MITSQRQEPKTTVISVITEINERKNRRNNLIIHGTKECISENKEERTKARGLILYTHRSLQAKEVAMDSEYGENIFVKIVLNSTDCLLIGLLYRSPTERLDGIDNNGNLNKLIIEASNKKFSHILLMGDINYPDIDWECYRTNSDCRNSRLQVLTMHSGQLLVPTCHKNNTI